MEYLVCLVGASNDAFGEIHNQPRLEYGMEKFTLMPVSPLWDHCQWNNNIGLTTVFSTLLHFPFLVFSSHPQQ